MHQCKTVPPLTIALIAALSMVLPAGCGAGTPAQATLPGTSSAFGDAAALRDVSGEFDGMVSDSYFGSGQASVYLSQYQNAAGGILQITFGSDVFTTPISYVVSGGKLTGSDNYQISGSSGVCAFSEAATYQNGHLNGSYQAVAGCMNDHGTFMTKQRCRFSQGTGIDFAPRRC